MKEDMGEELLTYSCQTNRSTNELHPEVLVNWSGYSWYS